MREIDPDSLDILTGSRSGDRLVAYVWYDGELAWPVPLTVGSWKCAWDDSAQIKGSIQLDVVDNSGQLSPWLHDDPLGVGGSQVQLLYQIGGGGGLVNLGWFRITKNAPQDEWRLYQIEDREYTRTVGAVVWTNLVRNPRVGSLTDHDIHPSMSSSLVDGAVRGTRTAGGATAIYATRGTRPAVTEGQLITVMAKMRASVVKPYYMRVAYNGSTLLWERDEVTLDPVEWTEHRMKVTVPAGAASVGIDLLDAGSGAVGDWMEIKNLLIVDGDYDGPYFDGSTDDDPLVPDEKHWNGVADLSTSTRNVVVVNETPVITPDTGLDPGMRIVSVPMGSIIPIDAEDLTVNVKNDRLIAPESPRTGTVISEIERLLGDIVPVTVLEGVEDEPISSTVIFERERLDAVEDLVSRLDAGWRMNGNGEFEIYPLGEATPVWQIVGGPEGALVRVRREQSLDGLENLFVSDGTRKTKNSKGEDVELPVRGISRIESGPLRDGGPHGRFSTFRSSPLITSEAMAKKDAQTFRDNHVRTQTINLQVTCLPNPAIETGDYVTVAHPVVDGRRVPLLGKVVKMELSGSDDSVNEMSLTVTCDAADVYEVMGGVDRGEPPVAD